MGTGAQAKRREQEAKQRLREWDAVGERMDEVARSAKQVAKRAVNGHRLKVRDGQKPGESG